MRPRRSLRDRRAFGLSVPHLLQTPITQGNRSAPKVLVGMFSLQCRICVIVNLFWTHEHVSGVTFDLFHEYALWKINHKAFARASLCGAPKRLSCVWRCWHGNYCCFATSALSTLPQAERTICQPSTRRTTADTPCPGICRSSSSLLAEIWNVVFQQIESVPTYIWKSCLFRNVHLECLRTTPWI